MCSYFWPIKPILIGEFENVNDWHVSSAWQRTFNQSAQFQGEDARTNAKHGLECDPLIFIRFKTTARKMFEKNIMKLTLGLLDIKWHHFIILSY